MEIYYYWGNNDKDFIQKYIYKKCKKKKFKI